MIDFVDMIFFHAVANPEKPAVITSEATLTYGMLRRGILAVGQQLRAQGLKPGDRVGVHILNAIGHVTLICALHRAGMISISLDAPQKEFLDDEVIGALLTNQPIAGTAARMIVVDESWFNGEPPTMIGHNLAQQADPHSTCRLILSSGTTGTPKIIALSYEAVQERLISYSIRTSTPGWDRIVCTPGLSTNYGYSFAIMTLWLGRTICFAFDSTARLLILSHRAEVLVASTFIRLPMWSRVRRQTSAALIRCAQSISAAVLPMHLWSRGYGCSSATFFFAAMVQPKAAR